MGDTAKQTNYDEYEPEVAAKLKEAQAALSALPERLKAPEEADKVFAPLVEAERAEFGKIETNPEKAWVMRDYFRREVGKKYHPGRSRQLAMKRFNLLAGLSPKLSVVNSDEGASQNTKTKPAKPKPAKTKVKQTEPLTRTNEGVRSDIQEAGASEDWTDDDIVGFFTSRLNADTSTRVRYIGALASVTGLGKRDLKTLLAKAESEARDVSAEDDGCEYVPVVNRDGVPDLVNHGVKVLEAANAKNLNANRTAILLHHDDPVYLEATSNGLAKLRALTEKAMKGLLNGASKWHNVSQMGDVILKREVSVTGDIVDGVIWEMRNRWPVMRGLVTTPVFAKNGSLITRPGLHDSGIYHWQDTKMNLLRVSIDPTKAEAWDAFSYLVQEVFADFPISGLNRAQIIEKSLGCTEDANGNLVPILDADGSPVEPEGVPAVTNAVAALLTPFVREIVGEDHNVPGILFGKNMPGTGASLLIDVISIIATGDVTPMATLPTTKDEMAKSLLTYARDENPYVVFDNVDKGVDSGELASVMTAPKFKGRGMHSHDSLEVLIRFMIVLTGNHVKISGEIVRRLLLADMNANMANPEGRSGWRHDDVRTWATKSRGKLVHACLTIIQHWVAATKMGHGTAPGLGSYEQWRGIMSGVFDAIGVKGLNENHNQLRETSKDGKTSGVEMILRELASLCANGQPLCTNRETDKIGGGKMSPIMKIADAENTVNDGCPIHLHGAGYDPETGRYFPGAANRFGVAWSKIAGDTHSVVVDGKALKVWFTNKQVGGHKTYFIHMESEGK